MLRKFIRKFGLEVISTRSYRQLANNVYSKSQVESQLQLFREVPETVFEELLKWVGESKSQLRQDLFVLWQTSFKTNGYFVEFGATDGISLSNTHLLETHFQWSGILAEPAEIWHQDLKRNRPNSQIDLRCVWQSTGCAVEFNETISPELSTIQEYANCDFHALSRGSRKNLYKVETISLQDLLVQYGAPHQIDYLSIDTEGSEFDILSAVDFTKYMFSIITVEHNFTESREKIFQLLSRNGYKRIFSQISKFDDWYVYQPRTRSRSEEIVGSM
jgi:FkbM family methyltransferase